jgi:hypothetical protein
VETNDPNATPAPNDPVYAEARRHVDAVRGFYHHLTSYVCVMAFLTILNYMTAPDWWVQWPALGWGVAVALHGLNVFGRFHFLGAEWERRKIEEYMARRRR